MDFIVTYHEMIILFKMYLFSWSRKITLDLKLPFDGCCQVLRPESLKEDPEHWRLRPSGPQVLVATL